VASNSITPAIVSLAILKVNWDKKRKDYVDNFVPIVAEAIRLSHNDVVSLPALQQDLLSGFGLRIPQNQLRAILSRVSKHGYIRSENRVFKRVPEELAKLTFDSVQRQVVAKHEQVLKSVITFAKERFGLDWTLDLAEAALYGYLASYQLLDPDAIVAGAMPKGDIARIGSYVIGQFVTSVRELKMPEFEYFETVAKGDILATSIFLPDPNRTAQKFKKTYVYLDTSLLIYALGHAGEARQAPCLELVNLLYEAGAELRCFAHTLDEMRSILIACALRMETNKLADAYGPTIEYFIEKGLQASDVRLRAEKLERDLNALRVKVVEKPALEKELMIDEQGLADAIEAEHKYVNKNALWRDVSSISSVIQLRRGHETQLVEECRALFVTTNNLLVVAAKAFQKSVSHGDSVPPVMTDHALTNILWLKLPLAAPDLPRKRLIAASFAAAQPDDQLWDQYLSAIQKLKDDKTVSEDDYFLLRHSLQARAALMQVTLGDEDSFAAGTVQEILEIVHNDIQRGLREKLEEQTKKTEQVETSAAATIDEVKRTAQQTIAERDAANAAEQRRLLEALAEVTAREESRRQEIRGRAVGWAQSAIRVLEIVAVIVLLIGAALPFVTSSMNQHPRIRVAASVLQLALIVFGVANLQWGTSVQGVLRRLELWLSDQIEHRLLSLADLVPTEEGAAGPSQL
jgi:hypothetical protein